VGIFGGWGTGKTTMMKMIENEIKKNYSDVATTL
jgi:uridine kinase